MNVTPLGSRRGGDGFAPTEPVLRASFFAAGATVARARDLGIVDLPGSLRRWRDGWVCRRRAPPAAPLDVHD